MGNVSHGSAHLFHWCSSLLSICRHGFLIYLGLYSTKMAYSHQIEPVKRLCTITISSNDSRNASKFDDWLQFVYWSDNTFTNGTRYYSSHHRILLFTRSNWIQNNDLD